MNKITKHFSQLDGLQQEDVDFVDIYLGIDNPLYFDFNKVYSSNDLNSKKLVFYINDYMSILTKHLFNGNNTFLKGHLEGIHESNETYLGMSALSNSLPQGNSIGYKLKKEIFDNLCVWKELLTTNPIIDSLQYGIKEIGPDRISDIVISICKKGLIEFTQLQCLKYNIPMESFIVKYYDLNKHEWNMQNFDLPAYREKALIMIPKKLVSTDSQLNSNFNFFIKQTFDNYFCDLERLKTKVREPNNLKTPLKRYEFDEAIKKEGSTVKDISKEALSDIENSKMINMIGNIRQRDSSITDNKLNSIIEESYQSKINKIA